MKKLISFFNFNFLKKINRYFLQNYTLIGNFKLHYIFFYSLSMIIVLRLINLTPSQISEISKYIILITIIIYLFWLYIQNKPIDTNDYNKMRLHGKKEYFLYLFSTIIFFFPSLMLSMMFFQTIDNFDNFKLLTYTETPNGFIYIDGISHLNTLNKDFLNKTVDYVNSSDIVTTETFKLAQKKIENMLFISVVSIAIIMFLPIQIIFFKYIKVKRSIFILFILYLYLIFMILLIKDTEQIGTTKKTVDFVLQYILIGNLLFLLYKPYRTVLIFNLFLYALHVFLYSVINIRILIFLIEIFLFAGVSQYLMFLMSKPKE